MPIDNAYSWMEEWEKSPEEKIKSTGREKKSSNVFGVGRYRKRLGKKQKGAYLGIYKVELTIRFKKTYTVKAYSPRDAYGEAIRWAKKDVFRWTERTAKFVRNLTNITLKSKSIK